MNRRLNRWPETTYCGKVLEVFRLPAYPGWLDVIYRDAGGHLTAAHVIVIEHTWKFDDAIELRHHEQGWAFRVNGCPWIPLPPCAPCGETEEAGA